MKQAPRWAALWMSVAVAGVAFGFPTTVGRPPPGSVQGTFPCPIGDDHQLAGYGRDLGCLLANVTLAALAGPLNPEWSRSLAPEVIRLAKHASTVWQPPDSPYTHAVSILLTPVELHAADFQLTETACAHAVQAAEAACLAFYCGSPGLRPASAELTETVRRLERVCATKLACKPHEHGLDPAECHEPWARAQALLGQAIEAKHRVRQLRYSPGTERGVEAWLRASESHLDTVQRAVRAEQWDAADRDLRTITEVRALPALKGMRSEEIDAARRQLRQLDAAGPQTFAATEQRRTRLQHQEARLQEAAELPPERQLDVLSRPLPPQMLRPLQRAD